MIGSKQLDGPIKDRQTPLEMCWHRCRTLGAKQLSTLLSKYDSKCSTLTHAISKYSKSHLHTFAPNLSVRSILCILAIDAYSSILHQFYCALVRHYIQYPKSLKPLEASREAIRTI